MSKVQEMFSINAVPLDEMDEEKWNLLFDLRKKGLEKSSHWLSDFSGVEIVDITDSNSLIQAMAYSSLEESIATDILRKFINFNNKEK